MAELSFRGHKEYHNMRLFSILQHGFPPLIPAPMHPHELPCGARSQQRQKAVKNSLRRQLCHLHRVNHRHFLEKARKLQP